MGHINVSGDEFDPRDTRQFYDSLAHRLICLLRHATDRQTVFSRILFEVVYYLLLVSYLGLQPADFLIPHGDGVSHGLQ